MHATVIVDMGVLNRILNCILAAVFAIVTVSLPLQADETGQLERLFIQLKEAEPGEARKIAAEIELLWSNSGSPAFDLLLKRGRDALEAGDSRAAIQHLTALTDHAPEFAEGWHTRSIAYAELGLFGPALADIERTLALQPKHYNAMISLSALLEELNYVELARDALIEAQAIHPQLEAVTSGLERLESQLGGAEL